MENCIITSLTTLYAVCARVNFTALCICHNGVSHILTNRLYGWEKIKILSQMDHLPLHCPSFEQHMEDRLHFRFGLWRSLNFPSERMFHSCYGIEQGPHRFLHGLKSDLCFGNFSENDECNRDDVGNLPNYIHGHNLNNNKIHIWNYQAFLLLFESSLFLNMDKT